MHLRANSRNVSSHASGATSWSNNLSPTVYVESRHRTVIRFTSPGSDPPSNLLDLRLGKNSVVFPRGFERYEARLGRFVFPLVLPNRDDLDEWMLRLRCCFWDGTEYGSVSSDISHGVHEALAAIGDHFLEEFQLHQIQF
jgi:hypothetical protein